MITEVAPAARARRRLRERRRAAGAAPPRGAARPLAATALLRLMWLASPALPVGGFSYSEGLESAIERGLASDEAGVKSWLLDQLMLCQARADLAAVAQAIPAWRRLDGARVVELNDWVRLTRESAEFRQQTEQMGRSMLDWLRQRDPDDAGVALLASLRPAPCWPVAWALAAALSHAPVRDALTCHAFGWAENMVQSAIKAVPLGQGAGQRILQALTDAIPAAVDAALTLPGSGRQAFSPMLAILSAQHETQYSRLFRS